MRLAISLSRVLLPQPDGPIRVTNSPSRTVRSTGASARVPFAKVFSADRTSTAGSPDAGTTGAGGTGSRSRRASAIYIPTLRSLTKRSV